MKKSRLIAIIILLICVIVGLVFWYRSGLEVFGFGINPSLKRIYLRDPQPPLLIYETENISFKLSASSMATRLNDIISRQRSNSFSSTYLDSDIKKDEKFYLWIIGQSAVKNEIDLKDYNASDGKNGNDALYIVDDELKTGNAIVIDEETGQKVKYVKYHDNNPHIELWSYDMYFELPSGRRFFYIGIIS